MDLRRRILDAGKRTPHEQLQAAFQDLKNCFLHGGPGVVHVLEQEPYAEWTEGFVLLVCEELWGIIKRRKRIPDDETILVGSIPAASEPEAPMFTFSPSRNKKL